MAIRPVYAAIGALTWTDLSSLPDTEFSQSIEMDNSTLLYMEIDLFIKIHTTTDVGDATGYCNVYLAASPDGGTDFSGKASGSDATYVPDTDAAAHYPTLLFIGRIAVDAVDASARTYHWNKRVKDLPSTFSFVIENQTGAVTGASCSAEYQGINFNDA